MKEVYMKAVIFDLDGTLINSLENIASCMNSSLSEAGFATHEVEKFKFFISSCFFAELFPEGFLSTLHPPPPGWLAGRLGGRQLNLIYFDINASSSHQQRHPLSNDSE